MAKTPATVQTIRAEEIKTIEAVLRGYLWDKGSANGSVVYYIFEWGKTTSYGTWGDYVQVTDYNAPGYVLYKATSLDPDSDYHFRIDSVIDGDWNYGEDRAFHTRATSPGGAAGYLWVEGGNLCYMDENGHKKVLEGEG